MAATGDAPREEKFPTYASVDGFRLPGGSSAEAFRSALAYEPRPGDLFVVSYPKCGTTWVLNIVACIYRAGEPFELAMEFLKQVPFLEITGAESAETMQRPGAIKTHLPFHMIPKSREAKYIFVARNPKDCCVSFYYHTKKCLLYDFVNGDFDTYFELFMEGKTDFGDYFDCLMPWFEQRNEPNVLFITYEDMKKELRANVLQIAEFMGQQYKEVLEKDESLLHDIIKHSSFDFMKEHLDNLDRNKEQKVPATYTVAQELDHGLSDVRQNLPYSTGEKITVNMHNPTISLIRKGVVGDWRNHFSAEQNKTIEKKFKEKTAGTTLAERWKDVM